MQRDPQRIRCECVDVPYGAVRRIAARHRMRTAHTRGVDGPLMTSLVEWAYSVFAACYVW